MGHIDDSQPGRPDVLPPGLAPGACQAFRDVEEEFHDGLVGELRRRRRSRPDLTRDDVYEARAVVVQTMCRSRAREGSVRGLSTGLIAIGSVGVGSMALDAGHDPTRCGARSLKRFILYRERDATGVSGTGVVATGVVWPDGHAALRWKADDRDAASSTSVWSSVADLLRVHGHGGLSKIFYLDGDSNGDEPPELTPGATKRASEAPGRAVEPWSWPSH